MTFETDTVVTPILTKAAGKWRIWGPWIAAALAWAWSMSNTVVHKQVANETLATDVATLKSDMQGLKASVATTNIQLATIQGTLNGINMKTDSFGKFKDDFQKGAKEALAMPVKQGHRAKR